MIPVELAPEPINFDRKVRRPGLDAIAELVGEIPQVPRPGPRRAKVADRREEIPPSRLPAYWRRALDDLMDAYHRLCAYTALYIEPGTGGRSVDHVIPKSLRWDRAYEWSNYRLACSLVNAKKTARTTVLDPFEIAHGWFALELVCFQVRPGQGLDSTIRQRVQHTINALALNDRRYRDQRAEYAHAYFDREITWSYVVRRAPFVAYELRAQGRLHPEDE